MHKVLVLIGSIGWLVVLLALNHKEPEKVQCVVPPPQDISKQCMAWMFEANFNDVKQRVCGGK